MAAWVPVDAASATRCSRSSAIPTSSASIPTGNQLPYIDEVRFTYFADAQALNLAAIAGEFDMQERHIQMTNYPVFKEQEKSGKYRVITWPTFGGADAVIAFNPTYKADPEIGKLMADEGFPHRAVATPSTATRSRRSVFLGLGEARQGVPAPWHPYFPGDEWAQKYTEFNRDEANKLLDGIGLTKKDARASGCCRTASRATIEISVVPAFGAWPDVAQLVAKDWEEVGIKTIVQIRERALHFKMRDANELMTEMWNEDTTRLPLHRQRQGRPAQRADPDHRAAVPAVVRRPAARKAWSRRPEMKRIVEIVDKARTVGPEGQVKLAQELYRIWADNVYEIGTVGLTPMVQGVVVVNTKFRNVPDDARQRLAAAQPGQRADRAVLSSRSSRLDRPRPVPPTMGPGAGAA